MTIAAIHTVVKSGHRESHRFGAGILPYVPFAGRMPYTVADADWAVQAFADSGEPDWDSLAEEAELQARYKAQAPTIFGHCQLCGMSCDDLTFQGLCDRCDDLATDASIACRNLAAGIGFKVF